jgi:cell division protein FtsB
LGPRRLRVEPARYQYLRTVYKGRSLAKSPRLRWGLIALALAVYTATFVGGDRGVVRRARLQRDLKDVTAVNAQLLLDKERLLQEVKLKENDRFSLEKLAREKYWLVGPGEVVYRFEDDEVVDEAKPETAPAPLPGDEEGEAQNP